LFQLVNRRYALKRSTIVTTNVPVGRWGDVFGSNVTASAVADRLCHHCAMIKITGRSYRLKDVSIGGEDGKEDGA
ncbi:MAG: ATP-binding protein, partial [Collinsella aerofaciens]